MIGISFVMWGLGGAGGELLIYRIADQLAKEGHTVNLIALVGWNYTGYNPTKHANVITQPRFLRPLFSIEWLLEFNRKFKKFSWSTSLIYEINKTILRDLIKKVKSDVIIATSWYTFIPAALAGARYAFVQDVVEAYYANDQWAGVRKYIQKAFLSDFNFLSISSYTDNLIRSFNDKAKIYHVGYFIADEFFNVKYVKPSERKRRILAIARPANAYHKGLDILVRAMRELHARRRDFEVHIVNVDGVALGNLGFEYVEHPRLPWKELADLYATSYVFVYTSRHESFGLPPVEAMATGTPVVMTRTEGSRDYGMHNYNSLITDVGDYKKIADYIEYLLDNPTEADRLSAGALETAKKFRFDSFMKRFKNAIGIE